VTDGALLGIKPIRRDAEHVIALDAHAVDDRTDDGAGLGRFVEATRGSSGRFPRDAFSSHERILACRGLASKGGRRHPEDMEVASLRDRDEMCVIWNRQREAQGAR
jgi:hypothetical protein